MTNAMAKKLPVKHSINLFFILGLLGAD